jgi:hypothetical protein
MILTKLPLVRWNPFDQTYRITELQWEQFMCLRSVAECGGTLTSAIFAWMESTR